jgi:hypothetical protein
MTEKVSTLRYETLCVRRPGLTRDLPPGKEDLQWVANTATLIHGERDAVLVDTFLTIEQNKQLVDWVKGSYDTLPIIRTFPNESQSSALVIRLREDRSSFFERCIAEGDCISS